MLTCTKQPFDRLDVTLGLGRDELVYLNEAVIRKIVDGLASKWLEKHGEAMLERLNPEVIYALGMESVREKMKALGGLGRL